MNKHFQHYAVYPRLCTAEFSPRPPSARQIPLQCYLDHILVIVTQAFFRAHCSATVVCWLMLRAVLCSLHFHSHYWLWQGSLCCCSFFKCLWLFCVSTSMFKASCQASLLQQRGWHSDWACMQTEDPFSYWIITCENLFFFIYWERYHDNWGTYSFHPW